MDSGHNFTYICNTQQCYLNCYTNGCNNVASFICGDSNPSCTLSVGCRHSVKNDLCQEGYGYDIPEWISQYNGGISDRIFPKISDNYYLPLIKNKLLITNEICDKSKTKAINCDDFENCSNFNNLTNLNVSICCTGEDSCIKVPNIATIMNNPESTIPIICAGVGSCDSIDMIKAESGMVRHKMRN